MPISDAQADADAIHNTAIQRAHHALYDRQERGILHARAIFECYHGMGQPPHVEVRWFPEERTEHACHCWGCVLWDTDPAAAREATAWIVGQSVEAARQRQLARPWHERFIDWCREMQPDDDDDWNDW